MVLFSKDDIALSSNTGTSEAAAPVAATCPINNSVWGDLAEMKPLEKARAERCNLRALAVAPKACAPEQGGAQEVTWAL